MIEAIYFSMLLCAVAFVADKVIIWMMNRVDNSETGYLRVQSPSATRSYPLTRKEQVPFGTRVIFLD